MTIKLFGVLIFAGLFTLTAGAGSGAAQELTVKPEHPRIWLTKQTAAKLNDTKLLKELTAPQAGLISRSLAYAIAGDKETGRRAIAIAKELLASGMGRLEAWEGYTKSDIHPAAICYDWCYDLLTPDEKKEFIQTMNAWAEWCARKAEKQPAYDSYFYGYLWGEAVVGLATSGDNLQAKKFIDHARFDLFEKRALPALEALGGDWVEGNGSYYGPVLLAFYAEAQKTACGENLYQKTPFFRQAVLHHLYASGADFKYFYPTGDVWRTLRGAPQVLYSLHPEHKLFLCMVRNNLGDSVEAKEAQWLLNKISGKSGGIEIARLDKEPAGGFGGEVAVFPMPAADALWNRSTTKPEPSPPDKLPTGYCNKKSGFVSFRSSWRDDALVVGFQSGPRLAKGQHLDQNSFCVFGGNQILMGPMTAIGFLPQWGRDDSFSKCTFVFDGSGQAASQNAGGKILAYNNAEHFSYAAGEAAAAYEDAELGYAPVKHFTRHMLLLRPATLVVLDRVETKPGVVKQWGAFVPLAKSLKAFAEPKDAADVWWKAPNLSWAPLLPQQRAALQIPVQAPGVNVDRMFNVVRIEVTPKEQHEDDLFLNVFSFETDAPPEVNCEAKGNTVELVIRGKREFTVKLAADNPGQGTVVIKEGANILFSGPLAPGN